VGQLGEPSSSQLKIERLGGHIMTIWTVLEAICGWIILYIFILAVAYLLLLAGLWLSGFIISAGRSNKRDRG
jgi:hypothetical protein